MNQQSPVLAILSDEEERTAATQLANVLGYSFAHIVMGTGHDAARFIEQSGVSPTYILMMIGARQDTVLEELSELANHCVAGTKLIVVGETNDIRFYRALIDLGVTDYFNMPADIPEIARAFNRAAHASGGSSGGMVVSFTSAAAGDGSSTIALNTAYSLAKDHGMRAVVVDMDYQFGMTAKNLDLSSPYGIKELFEHPDRGIDTTLLERMVIGYNNNLDIIAAPNELRFYPDVRPEVIRDLVQLLRDQYQYVILDLPHSWSPWIASAFNHSDIVVLVAQLWLKSVTHASRLLNVWREIGIDFNSIQVAINRSGAKFKEGVTARDFERVCQKPIQFYLPNDIRTVVNAENQGKTILELGKSKLASEIQQVATQLRQIRENSA